MAEIAAIKLNGQSVLLDYQGQACDFIDEYMPMEWVQPADHLAIRLAKASKLSIPEYSNPPALKINQAYWPTGASRWAYGFLLIESDGAAQLLESDHTPVDLEISSETTKITTSVYITRITPVNPTRGYDPSENRLHIVAFVDKRYWWQFRSVDFQSTTDKNSEWKDLVDEIAKVLEETTDDPDPGTPDIKVPVEIAAEYLKPDWFLLRYRGNAAMALDAIAGSVGRRVVVKWNGEVHLEHGQDAETNRSNQRTALEGSLISGGYSELDPKPDKLEVLFRKAFEHLPACLPGHYQEIYDFTGGDPADTQYTVNSTLWANFKYDPQPPQDPIPVNYVAITNLTFRMAVDYDHWNSPFFDETYQGVTDWTPTGHDDFQLHNYGVEVSRPVVIDPLDEEFSEPARLEHHWRRRSSVRIVGFPFNFGSATQMSRDPEAEVIEGEVLVQLVGDMIPGDKNIDAKIVSFSQTGTQWIDGPEVTITDYWPQGSAPQDGATCALAGEVLWVSTKVTFPTVGPTVLEEECQLVTKHPFGLTRAIRIGSDITPGSTGSGNIIRYDGTDGPQVVVKNRNAEDVIPGGSAAVGFYLIHDNTWHVLSAVSSGTPGGGAELYLLEAIDFIQPGQSGTAYLHVWNATSPCGWVRGPEVKTVYDSNGQNCLLPDEKVWCVKVNKTCDSQAVERYEILGSHGLRRRVRAKVIGQDPPITCGNTGTFEIMGETGQGSPGECNKGDPTGHELTCCHWWDNAPITIYNEDEGYASYDVQKGIWYVEPIDEPTRASATAAGSGCEGDGTPSLSVDVTDVFLTDRFWRDCGSVPDPVPSQASNPLGIPIRDGDKLRLERNIVAGRTSGASWDVVAVQPHRHYEVTNLDWVGDCPSLQMTRREFYGYSCDDVDDSPFTTSAGTIPVQNVRTVTFDATNCRLVVDNSTICVPPGGSVGAVTYPLTASLMELVKDVAEGSTQLDQTKQVVGVLCPGAEATTKILDFYDCPDPPPANVSPPV